MQLSTAQSYPASMYPRSTLGNYFTSHYTNVSIYPFPVPEYKPAVDPAVDPAVEKKQMLTNILRSKLLK